MPAELIPDEHFQFGGLCVLDFLADLLQNSGRDSWTRDEIVDVVRRLKQYGDLFEPATVLAYESAISSLTAPAGFDVIPGEGGLVS